VEKLLMLSGLAKLSLSGCQEVVVVKAVGAV
jgi:hypothetical protein